MCTAFLSFSLYSFCLSSLYFSLLFSHCSLSLSHSFSFISFLPLSFYSLFFLSHAFCLFLSFLPLLLFLSLSPFLPLSFSLIFFLSIFSNFSLSIFSIAFSFLSLHSSGFLSLSLPHSLHPLSLSLSLSLTLPLSFLAILSPRFLYTVSDSLCFFLYLFISLLDYFLLLPTNSSFPLNILSPHHRHFSFHFCQLNSKSKGESGIRSMSLVFITFLNSILILTLNQSRICKHLYKFPFNQIRR
ncbi:unnamed protein product [Acanthosepion pharaonis]|uniref:Uncharacterized protein n=1 Tax=Acanthosepion pharaonis TaxID=158019 RepID=A0A812D3S0_ACAPH|nr:unnamed protein product [Sepia pharaonis]